MKSTLDKIPQIDPDKLRAARDAAGLSQEQMGAIIGVTKAQVGNIENGYSKLGANYLPLWARACGILNVLSLYTDAKPNAFFTRNKFSEKSST